MDARKVAHSDTRWSHTFRADPSRGTHTFTPNGIGKYIHPIDLNKKGRVIHKCDTDALAEFAKGMFSEFRRRILLPWTGFAVNHPFKNLQSSFCFNVSGVDKSRSIEVVGTRPAIFWCRHHGAGHNHNQYHQHDEQENEDSDMHVFNKNKRSPSRLLSHYEKF